MDFEFSHSFDAPLADVAKALLDRDYQSSLEGVGPLKERTLLSQEEGPESLVVRRVRCVLGIDMGAAKSFIGNAEPAWVEEATWHPEKTTWEWVIVPEVGGDFLSAQGLTELHEEHGATNRVISGQVRVRVPIYGGKVEGWIVDGLKDAYNAEAERLSSWLDKGAAQGS